MKLTRRTFLVAAPLAIGAVLQFNGTALGQTRSGGGLFKIPELSQDALARLGWDAFLPFTNTDFTFGEGGNAVSLTLVSVEDTRPARLQGRRATKGQECFVLKFQGPFDRPLEQGTYRVNHFNLGDFDLFITNGGRVKRAQYYIAVINRIVS